MTLSRFGLLALAMLGLAACNSITSTSADDVYQDYAYCPTDLRTDVALDRPASEPLPPPPCNTTNPGGEMFDREHGQVGIPEGAAIIVTEVWNGLTGAK